jgi:hypothetical protein
MEKRPFFANATSWNHRGTTKKTNPVCSVQTKTFQSLDLGLDALLQLSADDRAPAALMV